MTLKMIDPLFKVRNFLPEDFDTIVTLETQGEIFEHGSFRILPFDLAESLGLPNRFPEENLFVLEANGAIVGYVYVMPELEIGRVVLSGCIHPHHQRKDVATRLVARALLRARELGVESVQVNMDEKNEVTKKFFSDIGFQCIRHFLELTLDVSPCLLPHRNEILSVCRHLKPGEEDKLTFIQNRSFIDTWGFNPSTKEEIVHRTRLPSCSPKNVLLLCEREQPIGYCWTRITSAGRKNTPEHTGQIHMLGVDPNHRGKGIGKQVLLAGLSYLHNEGVRSVELTVDEENKAAWELYKSFGFQISGRTVWYEKMID